MAKFSGCSRRYTTGMLQTKYLDTKQQTATMHSFRDSILVDKLYAVTMIAGFNDQNANADNFSNLLENPHFTLIPENIGSNNDHFRNKHIIILSYALYELISSSIHPTILLKYLYRLRRYTFFSYGCHSFACYLTQICEFFTNFN